MAGIPIGILHNSTIPVELFGDACDFKKKSEQTHGPMENIAATRVRIGSCWPQSWCFEDFEGEGNGQFVATCPQRKEVAIVGST